MAKRTQGHSSDKGPLESHWLVGMTNWIRQENCWEMNRTDRERGLETKICPAQKRESASWLFPSPSTWDRAVFPHFAPIWWVFQRCVLGAFVLLPEVGYLGRSFDRRGWWWTALWCPLHRRQQRPQDTCGHLTSGTHSWEPAGLMEKLKRSLKSSLQEGTAVADCNATESFPPARCKAAVLDPDDALTAHSLNAVKPSSTQLPSFFVSRVLLV